MIRPLAALLLLTLTLVPRGTEAASTIDTTQPVQGAPYNAAPIRQNFQHAASDIAALQTMNAGASAPASPTLGTLWLNTAAAIYTLSVYDNVSATWLPIGYLDSTNGLWITPVGGGLPASLAASDTTELGSLPQTVIAITGAGPIYSFGATAPAGIVKLLTFSGATQIVNNNTSLILPGGANINTQAGDMVFAVALGSGDWQVMFFQSAASAVAQGGTGRTSLTNHAVLLGAGTSPVNFAVPGTTGYPLVSAGASADPVFAQLSLTAGVTGVLPTANGGSGAASFTAHGVLLGEGAAAFGLAAPSTAGMALVSRGATVDPDFGLVSLTVGVTGILPVANGGTGPSLILPTANGGSGLASPAAHALLIAAGSSPLVPLAPGTSGYPLVSNGAAADPSYQPLNLAGGGVTGILPIGNLPAGSRMVLTADTAYCVATTGNDSNSGISPNCWLTLAHAWNYMISSIDLANHIATVNIANGTYAPLLAAGTPLGIAGAGSVVFKGDLAVPTNVSIAATNDTAINAQDGATLTIEGVHLQASGTGTGQGKCVNAGASSSINATALDFGVCAVAGLAADSSGFINVTGSYTIAGGGQYHMLTASHGFVRTDGVTVTLSGTPAFSQAFAATTTLGLTESIASSYLGSATGVRYNATLNGVIETQGGGATYFPGSGAGTTATGGQYD